MSEQVRDKLHRLSIALILAQAEARRQERDRVVERMTQAIAWVTSRQCEPQSRPPDLATLAAEWQAFKQRFQPYDRRN